ncbi:13221_t:CDS:2, partial [Ambispora leptoticha]
TSHDPMNRPAIKDIFDQLFDLSKRNLPSTFQPTTLPRPKELTIKDAINIHQSRSDDRNKAYQIFCKYANLGDLVAKYWDGSIKAPSKSY